MTHDPSHGPGPDPASDRAATKAPPSASAAAAPLVGDPWDAIASRLDALPDAEAQAALARCFGARRWVEAMLRARPFHDGARLDRAIDRAFDALVADDWLEAFAAHPRIGEKKERLAAFAHAEDSEREQAGVRGAHVATLAALSDGNRRYEEKFGHVFLVCATGKSADQMLAILRSRLANGPEAELAIAAGEQKKITRLRLAELR